jgi:hypothetical protein
LFVEIIEQEVKQDSVHQNEPGECLRIIAIGEQQLRCMEEHHDELDLKNGQKQRVRIISLKCYYFAYIYIILLHTI